MIPNESLRFHFLNAGHGDATIVEFPDFGTPPTARFGVIDFADRRTPDLVAGYMKELVDIRTGPGGDYRIEFACATHPHEDHFGGLRSFLSAFSHDTDPALNHVTAFWDCGFRTTSSTYNGILIKILKNTNISFVRLSAGTEYDFGRVHLTVLAPSIDLRNRFDTYGVDKNNASIVLRFKLGNSYAILAGDAEYESWGKVVEEFPRISSVNFLSDALGLAEREDTADQLKSDLLRASHHGSKHGTDLRCLERINPGRIVISAGSDSWYRLNETDWVGKVPHPVTTKIIEALGTAPDVLVTGDSGHIVVKYTGGWAPAYVNEFVEMPGDQGFRAALEATIR